jgi:hypothetical protein
MITDIIAIYMDYIVENSVYITYQNVAQVDQEDDDGFGFVEDTVPKAGNESSNIRSIFMDEASREEEYQDTIQIRTTEGGDEVITTVNITPLKFNSFIYKLLCISYDVLSPNTQQPGNEPHPDVHTWLKQITLRGSVLIEEYKENALVVAQTQVNSDAGVIAPRPLGKTTSMFNPDLKEFIDKICNMINSIPADNKQTGDSVIGKTNIMYLLRNYYETSNTPSNVSETNNLCYNQLTDLWNKKYPIIVEEQVTSSSPGRGSANTDPYGQAGQAGQSMEIEQTGGTQEQTDEMLEEDDDALMEYKFEGVDEDSEDNNKKIHVNIGSGGSSRYSRRHSKKYVHKTSIRARSSSKKSAKRGSRKMHVVKTKKHTRRNDH